MKGLEYVLDITTVITIFYLCWYFISFLIRGFSTLFKDTVDRRMFSAIFNLYGTFVLVSYMSQVSYLYKTWYLSLLGIGFNLIAITAFYANNDFFHVDDAKKKKDYYVYIVTFVLVYGLYLFYPHLNELGKLFDLPYNILTNILGNVLVIKVFVYLIGLVFLIDLIKVCEAYLGIKIRSRK